MLFDVLHGRLQPFQAVAHGRKQFQALVGDFHPPAVAAEKCDLNVSLQRFDLLTDRRGRHIEGIRGSGKTQRRCDRLEDAQRAKR